MYVLDAIHTTTTGPFIKAHHILGIVVIKDKIMKRNQFIAFIATSMMALAFSISDKDKAAEIIRYSGR